MSNNNLRVDWIVVKRFFFCLPLIFMKSFRNKGLSWLILFLLIMIPFPPCFAQGDSPALLLTREEQTWLDQNPEKLVLYFNQDFPPIEFVSNDGRFMGMAAGVIAIIEKRLGVTFIKYPSQGKDNPVTLLQKGASAMAPALVRTPEREQFALFTTVYASIPLVVIAKPAFEKFTSLDDFKGRRIAVVSKFASENYLRNKSGGHFEIVPVSTVLDGLVKVSLGQVDAMVENLAVAAFYIEKGRVPDLHVICSLDQTLALRLGVNRSYPLLHSAIQKALDVTPDHELDALKKEWMAIDISRWLSPKIRLVIKLAGLFVVLLVTSLAGIGYVLKKNLNKERTNLKNAQQEILNQAKTLQMATEATRAWIWDFNPANQTGNFSDQWYLMFGYPPRPSGIPLSEWSAFIHTDDRASADDSFKRYIESGASGEYEAEFRIQKADGSWCWVLSKGRAVSYDEKGAPLRILGLGMNIETIKKMQENLAQSEAKFRALFENAPYAITIHNLDGMFLDVNNAFLESRGVSKEKVLQMHSSDFSKVSDEEVAEIMDSLMTKGRVSNRDVLNKKNDGTDSYSIFSSTLLDIQGQKQILSITIDVTEQKKAEKALKKSEEKFRSLFKMGPLPMASTSMEGGVIEINDRMTELLGYTVDDIKTLENWWSLAYPDPDYRAWVKATWQQAVDQAMSTGNPVESGEYRVTCKDGTERIIVIGGTVIGGNILSSFFDITDRKQAEEEREKLQIQLNQAQKLEAVGILAGGVAHDFNNMLGAIIGYAEIMLSVMGPDSPDRQYAGEILNAAQRSAGLTRQLLAFARKQAIDPVVFDLNVSVGTILSMLRRLIGENIGLDWKPCPDVCMVEMDPTQLDQILANLCVNAGDAITDVGNITIETQRVSFDALYCKHNSGFVPGDFVLLSVSDDGGGMDKDTLEHIFEPFFTTKGLGCGTGLGLATVYGIIKQNNGFIDVSSEIGRGTVFRLYLPHRVSGTVKKGSQDPGAIPHAQGETILFVEDDPTLLDMGKMMLGHLGYQVFGADSPHAAIRLAQEESADIHLFIMDVVMPEMNGWDLSLRLQKIRPGVKQLFMSGYTANVTLQRGVQNKDIKFIQKPFSLKEFAVKVRKVLDED
ncbi:MAG: PAS domain S-box protein [Proteobacteria bacterium]|nr:PAS domain S-box protein [Pseudomonadota bacterium]